MKNLEGYYAYDKIFSYSHLYEAYLNCRKGVCWKASVQKFNSQINFNLFALYKKLKNRKWKHGKYYSFNKLEDGKLRFLQAEHFKDRIVQRCFCDYSLIPILSKSFIYDNSASQKNKGIDFAIKRCKWHLTQHLQQFGKNGYILQFDFHHYFENISKDKVHKMLENIYTDRDILNVAFSMIDNFENGLGLGSQLSQTLALYYPNKLDHIIKEHFHIKGYGRYMDDGYVICNSKEKLEEILSYLKKWNETSEIPLNKIKTHIIKLSKGFTFLKRNFCITKTNHIILRINKKKVHAMKRKIKALKNKFNMDNQYIYQIVNSWSKTFEKYNCYKQMLNVKCFANKILGGYKWNQINIQK